MRFGVYRKKRTGKLYQFLLLARNHYSGEHVVVYVPLRVEPEWAGTIRPCWISRGDFESKFEFVGEGLPTPLPLSGDTWCKHERLDEDGICRSCGADKRGIG